MSLAQLHYTLAPSGPQGFAHRFTHVSPGTPAALLHEAEPLLRYEPPAGASTHPHEDELRSWPRAFSCSALADGGRLLSRVVPVATGPDGPGAFHAHAVHLPPGHRLPGGAPPVTAWGAPGWRAHTPDTAAAEPAEHFTDPGALDRDGLTAFALARATRLADFFADLREVTEARRRPAEDGGPGALHVVVVETDTTYVVRWIALATSVLPDEAAHSLTFTTYTRRPREAGQQLLGVRPEDVHEIAGDRRYRVHEGAHDPVGGGHGERDVWARTAALVWRRERPELLAAAAALDPAPFAAGPLALAAVDGGVPVDSEARAAAAHWLGSAVHALDGERCAALLAALCAADTTPAGRSPRESAALAELLRVVRGRLPASATAPLAAAVLTDSVRDAALPVPALGPAALPEPLRRALGAELAEPLRRGIGAGEDLSRRLDLLRVAHLLEVECAEEVPAVAEPLCRALLDAPEAAAEEVRAALRESRVLRMTVLDTLEERAALAPGPVRALLRRVPLPLDTVRGLPHLRMCVAPEAAEVPEGAGDRVEALRGVLRASGMSLFSAPEVMRTAVALVWEDVLPTAAEARTLLNDTGSDVHRAAGTWRVLVRAALQAPASEGAAPGLAADLLRCFLDGLAPDTRAALTLRAFAGELDTGEADPAADWAARVVELRAAAGPVAGEAPAVREQAGDALARRLLRPDRPEGQLYALAGSGDAELLGAYRRVATGEAVRARLAAEPAFAADCFVAWQECAGASAGWDTTRAELLDQVLRPAVRSLPSDGVEDVTRRLRALADRWADRFETWNRPGALGRLVRRLGGR